MDLYEYEGKQIFKTEGIITPKAVLMRKADPIQKKDIDPSMFPCVAKGQVLEGKRAEKGLITFIDSRESMIDTIDAMLQKETDMEHILLEEKIGIAKEIYIAITIDPTTAKPLIMISSKGGSNIESRSDSVSYVSVDPFIGLRDYHIQNLISKTGIDLDKNMKKSFGKTIAGLFNIFINYDAELVEVNPLVVTTNGEIVALDSKIRICDNSIYRHHQFNRIDRAAGPQERFAAEKGIRFIKLEGNIGVLCAGAGLTMATLDLIVGHGGKPANFMEIGGSDYHKGRSALELLLMDKNIKVILVNTFGLIARADVIAENLVKAIDEIKPSIPIVAAIRGTGQDEAIKLLRGCRYVEAFSDSEDLVARAVDIVGSAGE